MHDGGWFGMGGMWLYWSVPILIVVVVAFWMFSRRRSAGGR